MQWFIALIARFALRNYSAGKEPIIRDPRRREGECGKKWSEWPQKSDDFV